MKTLLSILMLILITACGSGGSNGGANVPHNPIDDNDTVYEYRLYVNGVQGTSFISEAIRNFGDGDQANVTFSYTMDASETQNMAVFGRSVFWQIEKTGGGDLNVRITKDGVEVANETITVNGQVITLSNNI